MLRHSTDQTVQLPAEGQPGEGLLLQFTHPRSSGQHFDSGTGTALLGIKEHAQLIGGTTRAEYLPQHFRLTIRLPWTGESDEATVSHQEPFESTHVLASTSFDLESYTCQALQAGAAGFILKNDAEKLLI